MARAKTKPPVEPSTAAAPDGRRERTPSPANAGRRLPLPHERDTSHGQVNPEPDPIIERAARDLAEGQVDTDLRATPGLDAQRRRKLVRSPQATKPESKD